MDKPRAAVIGGGILGVSCALELADFCDVTVFEQERDIMEWGTYGNQYRHHLGYHYPRSPETVRQCLKPQADFLSIWKEAVVSDYPSYYAIAQSGSKVSAEEFIDFCKEMGLSHEVAYPDPEFLNPEAVDICIKTNEAVYDFPRLRSLAKEKMAEKNISLKLPHKVIGGEIDEINEKKKLKIQTPDGEKEEIFDYVVGAMYANHNLFANWFDFPINDIELRLKEVVIIRLPLQKKLAVTIMDGPFVTIVPVVSEPNTWTLGDVPRSVHEKIITKGGVPWTAEEMKQRKTRFEDMRLANRFYIPIMPKAEFVKSIMTILPILPDSDKTDERLTTVKSYGKGCWSVFEGKIVTCVAAAKEVARQIKTVSSK